MLPRILTVYVPGSPYDFGPIAMDRSYCCSRSSANAHYRKMARREKMKRFVPKYLDPASRLGEILFGLIMVLTMTLTAGLTAADGKEGVHQLLWAAIGCNIAWGVIDAVMYVMNCITVRSGKVRLVEAVQSAPDAPAALNLIREQIEPELQELLDPEDAEAMSHSVLKHIREASIKSKSVSEDDFYGALACFCLVFFSCLPA